MGVVYPAHLQVEVEAFYSSNGFLLPSYHQFYWMGLRKVCKRTPDCRRHRQAPLRVLCACNTGVTSALAAGSQDTLRRLQANPIAPFTWLDGTVNNSFFNWGTYMPGNYPEPNNLLDQEYCAGANYTQSRNGAWGWADYMCAGEFIYMCRILCKHHLAALAESCRACPARLPCSDCQPSPAHAHMLGACMVCSQHQRRVQVTNYRADVPND